VRKKERKKQASKQARGLSHCGLAIYIIKKDLQANRRIMETQIYNLQKII
jgi:hypothetical protein